MMILYFPPDVASLSLSQITVLFSLHPALLCDPAPYGDVREDACLASRRENSRLRSRCVVLSSTQLSFCLCKRRKKNKRKKNTSRLLTLKPLNFATCIAGFLLRLRRMLKCFCANYHTHKKYFRLLRSYTIM